MDDQRLRAPAERRARFHAQRHLSDHGLAQIAQSISADLKQRLPGQRKTQRENLALLIATMLDVRSANLVDLAAGLPRDADRTDMRFQWISRFLSNTLVVSDIVMEPYARAVLERMAEAGAPLVLILDQSKVSDRFQVLMLAVRFGERALPLAWRVRGDRGGDRGWCQVHGWGYRLRLKGNLTVFDQTGRTTTGACARERVLALKDVALTAKRARTNIGIIHDPGHPEPWIIAMSDPPGYLKTLDYGQRWGIEPMFSDFKSRGFGLEHTQIRHADRVDRLILVMALALH